MYIILSILIWESFVDLSNAFDSIHREKMEQILLGNGLPKETDAAIMRLYKNMKVKVRSPDVDTYFFDIVAGVLQWDKIARYMFIICLDYFLSNSIELMKENGFTLAKAGNRTYPPEWLRMRIRLMIR